jgi:hypothetical protein
MGTAVYLTFMTDHIIKMYMLFPACKQENRKEGLLIFSWYTNGKRLMSTKSSSGTFECLHGIRFLSITWIAIGHVLSIAVFIPQINIIDYGREVSNTCIIIIIICNKD